MPARSAPFRQEIAHALGDGIPVIGLNTWSFSRNGKEDENMIPARDPVDAVEKAIAAAESRTEASTGSGRQQ